MKLFSPDAAHWYQRDGQPLHTVLSAKGEPRPTTLRDARKLFSDLVIVLRDSRAEFVKIHLLVEIQLSVRALTLCRIPRVENAAAIRIPRRTATANRVNTRDDVREFLSRPRFVNVKRSGLAAIVRHGNRHELSVQ
jgi:hypothetical protein